ncbi:hypothetical protein ACFQZQ_13125 [Lysobacter koreensis]|uniref:DUF5666 domain-containing protein n=1 Tax=Lysobacter koreensis TaxID=266122 RepID=A0ABW2YP68_9GAMM
MIRFPRHPSAAVIAIALAALSACASTPTTADALVVGQQATIEGTVVGVDTAPWAYDGNAVVTVSTRGAGIVRVQLPARWNLCKAQPLGDVQSLQPSDRVQAVGTVTGAGELVVCEQPQHRLRKLD